MGSTSSQARDTLAISIATDNLGGGGLTLKLETGFQDDGACGSVSFLGLLPNLQIATFLLQPHWMENNNWRPFP